MASDVQDLRQVQKVGGVAGVSSYRRYPPRVNWGCLGALFMVLLFWIIVFLLRSELS